MGARRGALQIKAGRRRPPSRVRLSLAALAVPSPSAAILERGEVTGDNSGDAKGTKARLGGYAVAPNGSQPGSAWRASLSNGFRWRSSKVWKSDPNTHWGD